MLKHSVFPNFHPCQLQRTPAILNCTNPITVLQGKVAYVVRESSGPTADTCRVDEVGQVKFKLALNVTADWSFLPCHISDADCSGLKFWFKHWWELTITVCRRPVSRRKSITSSMGTGYPLDKLPELLSNHKLRPKLFPNFPKNISVYKQTRIFLLYIFFFSPIFFHTLSFPKCDKMCRLSV